MRHSKWWAGYLVGGIGTVLAASIRHAFNGVLGHDAPLYLFTAAVMAAGVCGGWKPGLVTTGFSALVATSFFIGRNGWIVTAADDCVRLLLFAGVGVSVSFLCEARLSARRTIARQQALLSLSETYRGIVEYGAALICRFQADGVLTFVNETYCRYFGRAKSELIGHTFPPLVPDEDRPFVNEMLQVLKPDMAPYTLEHRARLGDGHGRWLRWTNQAVHDATGRFVEYQAIGVDITDRRDAETHLRERNASLERQVAERTDELREVAERFQMAVEATGMGVWETSYPLATTRLDARLKAMWGLPDDEVITLSSVLALVHPDDRSDLEQAMVRSLNPDGAGLFAIEHRIRTPSSEEKWVAAWGRTVFGRGPHERKPVRSIGVMLDVTERRRAEERLRASEERFRRYFELGLIGMTITSPAKECLDVNDEICRILGYSREELLGKTWAEMSHPDDLAADVAQFERVMAGEIDGYRIDKRWARKDGRIIDTIISVKCLRREDGSVDHFVGLLCDVTERKRAERALRESEERYRSVVESLAEGIVSYAADGAILASNDRASEILGLSRDQIAGRTPLRPGWGAVHEDGSPFLGEEHPAMVALRTGRPVFNTVLGVRKPSGDQTWMTVNAVPIRGPDGAPKGVVASYHDITVARQLHDKLRASLREKEILLREIHHRVKNNLQIVSTLLDLQSDHTQDQAASELFRESQRRVKAMTLIHERLYRSEDIARVNIAEYLRQLADDLRHSYQAKDVEVVVEVDVPGLPIDAAITCGLLVNELLSNCFKHAFGSTPGGRIGVSLHRGGPSTYALTVADDGAGFPADLDFRGTTSFGMQLVHMLSRQLKGTVALKADRGTEITITFPASPAPPEEPIR